MLHGEEEVLGSKYNKKCFAESKWCDGRSKKKKRCKKKSKKCKQCFPCEKCEKCNKKCLKKKMCQFFTDQRALTLQRQKPKKCAACMKKCEKKVCELSGSGMCSHKSDVWSIGCVACAPAASTILSAASSAVRLPDVLATRAAHL